MTCTPAESRLTGSDLRGTFDGRVGLPLSRKRKIARIYERESRTEEVGRANSCCPPFAHWYPLVDIAFHRIQDTTKAHDDITLWDVAYTDDNPPGLDINRLATQEELLRLWWSKTPLTQPRWIVGEEIPRAAMSSMTSCLSSP